MEENQQAELVELFSNGIGYIKPARREWTPLVIKKSQSKVVHDDGIEQTFEILIRITG